MGRNMDYGSCREEIQCNGDEVSEEYVWNNEKNNLKAELKTTIMNLLVVIYDYKLVISDKFLMKHNIHNVEHHLYNL